MKQSLSRQWHPFEYAHVFLWLLKDLCWAQHWVNLGVIMVVPTVFVAYLITWLFRGKLVNLIHNLAISLWISSNSAWMIAEFYQVEPTLKPLAIVGFYAGLLLLAGFYGFQVFSALGISKKFNEQA